MHTVCGLLRLHLSDVVNKQIDQNFCSTKFIFSVCALFGTALSMLLFEMQRQQVTGK